MGRRFPVERQVAAVGVDVLTEQRDLDDALGGETLHLPEDVAGTAADTSTPHRGDDAEGAAVVAPDLDRNPGRVGQLSLDREGGGHRLEFVDDLGDPAPGLGVVDEVEDPVEVVGPHHDVDPRGSLSNQIAILLGGTTAHDEQQRPGCGP